MNEMIERVAKSLFLSRYSECDDFWPDRLDECVSGPPFEAGGYRAMARDAIKAMREPTKEMLGAAQTSPIGEDEADGHFEAWKAMIDAALDNPSQITPDPAGS